MQIVDSEIQSYERRILELEQELDEMTVELSQAWDQLVPFLQGTPHQAEATQSILSIIQATIAAVDTEAGGVYLFENEEWFSIPDGVTLPSELRKQLQSTLRSGESLQWQTKAPELTRWLFVPVTTDQQVVGAIGVGSHNKHVFNAADLRIVSRMAERVASQIVSTQLALSREREAKAQQEMRIASMIQRSIQPTHLPQLTGIQMARYWEPAKEVGGDAWGWILQSDGRLSWFVLDVAGKGLPAALAATSLYSAIRVGLRMCLSPAQILTMVNDEFYEAYTRTDLLATAAIVTFDPASGNVQVANAGHLPILIRTGGEWVRMKATAPPIGVWPETDPKTESLCLHKSDVIVCYSDGFTEIETDCGFWGVDGLQSCIPAHVVSAEMLAGHIMSEAHRLSRQSVIGDDQTLVVFFIEKYIKNATS